LDIKYFIEHCNLPLSMFAITLCDFKYSGMDCVKVITYLSLSGPVPLQPTISLKRPCRGVTTQIPQRPFFLHAIYQLHCTRANNGVHKHTTLRLKEDLISSE
jgi:hypothetical protein